MNYSIFSNEEVRACVVFGACARRIREEMILESSDIFSLQCGSILKGKLAKIERGEYFCEDIFELIGCYSGALLSLMDCRYVELEDHLEAYSWLNLVCEEGVVAAFPLMDIWLRRRFLDQGFYDQRYYGIYWIGKSLRLIRKAFKCSVVNFHKLTGLSVAKIQELEKHSYDDIRNFSDEEISRVLYGIECLYSQKTVEDIYGVHEMRVPRWIYEVRMGGIGRNSEAIEEWFLGGFWAVFLMQKKWCKMHQKCTTFGLNYLNFVSSTDRKWHFSISQKTSCTTFLGPFYHFFTTFF